ncbi:hypothetical protein DL89DRAFT_266244 [Linderina pennispora]|uniref:Uncharacterized protein n=1 Tax=Linderina pennispora TaxID=61395 RepID=A0A1Y1WCG9_9FUNG|nr:uncharacterized protein DL89DRAFT_266244 [Linderina pennispora]ORX71233.1 hypothetical protein DL89DRAFT_266244 [Linderina pennispora]
MSRLAWVFVFNILGPRISLLLSIFSGIVDSGALLASYKRDPHHLYIAGYTMILTYPCEQQKARVLAASPDHILYI